MSYSIGVFDSGLGGLTILNSFKKTLPDYDYVYFGDTKNAPYGNHKKSEIYDLTCHSIKFLISKNCKLIILACHTASSNSLRKIQKVFLKNYPGVKVLGVTIPICEIATNSPTTKRIGIMATKSTVKSGSFIKEIYKLNPHAVVFQKSCPQFVPLIESGQTHTTTFNKALKTYCQYLYKKNIDTLILGCTHYQLVYPKIKKYFPKIHIVSGENIGLKLKNYLKNHPEINSQLSKEGRQKFYTSGDEEKFIELSNQFFGKKVIMS